MDDSPISQWSTMTLSLSGQQQLSCCYSQAQLVGDSTASYLRAIVEHGRKEKQIIDGCIAILRLARIFGNEKVENGCKRALLGKKYNYTTLKKIITNGLADIPPDTLQQGDEDYKITHRNLRGASFFENN